MPHFKSLFPGIDAFPLVIAGPCSAESREMTLDTATRLAGAGVRLFRAGVWKPRTKPGSFEGIGAKALEWLVEVKKTTGMQVLTEVATPRHVELALEAGLDGVWIGARTTANPFAVQEIADALAANSADLAVLVKNPVNPDIELWIGALERLGIAGIKRLGAIHRGFSAYGNTQWRNPPMWHIPIELRRRFPTLPIITDPSHITGRRDLVAPTAAQAIEMGFDGLIIETHPDPDNALSDSAQQLTPAQLATLVASLPTPRHAKPATPTLEQLRRNIDAIDSELIALLAQRFNVVEEIGKLKRDNGIPILQMSRFDDMISDRMHQGNDASLDPNLVKRLFSLIHEEAVKAQLSQPSSR